MLQIRSGIKSIFRTKGKSILFVLLLTLLVTVLTLGFSIYHSIKSFLTKCEENFHSIAVLEYIGQEYPDMHVDDPELRRILEGNELPLHEMESLPGVLYFSRDSKALALTKVPRNDNMVYQKDRSVLSVYHLIYDAHARAYMGFIKECLYSLKDYTGFTVFIPEDSLKNLGEIDKNETYIFSGTYFNGPSSYIWFEMEEGAVLSDDVVYEAYQEKAEILSHQNNAFPVSYVKDLSSCYPFQQEILTLLQGTIFTEDTENKKVVVISDLMAGLLNVEVGDFISLSVNENEGGIYHFQNTTLNPSEKYEVLGVYAWTKEYPDLVFMPSTKEETRVPTGFTVGTFRLENRKSESFLRKAKEMLPKGFRLTLYDEGYNILASPYAELLKIMQVFLMVSLLIVVAVILLFEYLLVYKTADTMKTMRYLGTRLYQIYAYYFSGSFILFMAAALFGTLLSKVLNQYVFSFVQDFTSRFEKPNLAYSSSALSIVKTLEFVPENSGFSSIYSLLIILFVILLSVFFFMLISKEDTKKKKKTVVWKKRREVKGKGFYGTLRIAKVSLFRGSVRPLSVLLLTIASMLFLSVLVLSSSLYEKKLEDIQDRTVLRGYASDITGLNMNHLVIEEAFLKGLQESGLFSSLDVSKTVSHYRYVGVSKLESGEEINLPVPYIPEDSFGIDTLSGQMAMEPYWTAVSSLSNSPEFYYYMDEPPIVFYEGFSEKDLLSGRADLCILPESMMKREGIQLGDTIRIMTMTGNRWIEFPLLDLQVIGCYTAETTSETMYSPLAVLNKKLDPAVFYETNDIEESEETNDKQTYSSMIFTLKDARDLDLVKETLEKAGFTKPLVRDFKRSYAVIEDKDYLNTIRSLKRQIVYLDLLYRFLYVFMMVVSFVSAYLLLQSSGKDIILMKILGTRKRKILLNYMVEELVYLVLGLSITIVLVFLIEREISVFLLGLLLMYFLFSLLGTIVRLLQYLFTKKAMNLSEDE